MKIFISITILLSLMFNCYAQSEINKRDVSCSLTVKVEKEIKHLEFRSKQEDISADINSFYDRNFSNKLKKCQLDKLYEATKNLGKLNNENIRPRINRLISEVKYISNFRSPQREVELLNELLKKDGDQEENPSKKYFPKNELEKFIAQGIDKVNKKDPSKNGYCSDIDITKNSVVGSKVRSLGDLGWCYTASAADLISHETGVYASSLGAGLAFNSYGNKVAGFKTLTPDVDPDDNYGGFTDEAINIMLERGYCIEKEFPSRAMRTDGKDWNFISNVIKDMQTYWSNSESETNTCARLKLNLPGLDISLMYDISQAIYSNYFKRFYDVFCKEKTGIRKGMHAQKFKASTEKMIDKINEKLNSNHPLGITMNHLSFYYFFNDRNDPNHAVSVWGRRFHNGTCEYKLKGDWGNDCKVTLYHPSIQCKDGEFWMSEEQLARTLTDVTYINTSKK